MKRWIVLASSALLAACSCNGHPGHGKKIGQVVRMTREGVFWPTWEAQLIRGGMAGGSGSFGVVPFDFTVPDSLVPEVAKAIDQQTEVVINYETEFYCAPWRSASDCDFLVVIAPAPHEGRK